MPRQATRLWFNDEVLLKTETGQEFVDWYDRTSPLIADELRKHDGLRAVVCAALTPLVEFSKWSQKHK